MNNECKYCAALKWNDEAPGMCCNKGKVKLDSLMQLPEPLKTLYSKHYILNIIH